MTITVEQNFCVPVVAVKGSIHDRNWPELANAVAEVGAEGHQMIGLDLSSVKVIGLDEAQRLVGLRERLAENFQRLLLTGLSPCVIEAMGQVPKDS